MQMSPPMGDQLPMLIAGQASWSRANGDFAAALLVVVGQSHLDSDGV
jgi:hypothetical protein